MVHGKFAQKIEDWILPLAVLTYLCAMVARLYDAMGLSFWADELTSLHFAYDQWKALLWDNSPILFNLLLKLWPATNPLDEFSYRVLPFIFYAMTPWMLFLIGRRYFDTKTAAIALAYGSLLAVGFYYGVELRPYSLFAFASSVNIWFFLQVLDQRKITIGYMVSCGFLAFSHYFAAIALIAQFIIFIFHFKAARLALVPFALIGLGFYFVRTDSLLHLAFTPPWKSIVFPFELMRSLYSQSFWVVVIAALTITYGKILALDKVILISALSTIPIGLLTGLNPGKPHYFIFLAPYIVLLLAVFTVRLKRPFVAVLMVIHFFTLNLWIIRSHWGQQRSGWREAMVKIVPQPDTLVIPLAHVSAKKPYLNGLRTYFPPPEDQTTTLEAELQPSREVWLIYPAVPHLQTTSQDILADLKQRGYAENEQGTFSPNSAHPLQYVRLIK